MSETFLDRAIGIVSPRMHAKRLYYRTLIDRARAFDAAKIGRRTEGWQATGTSANAETGPALDRMRWRAREFERNNGHAAGMLRKWPAYLVGTGIVLRAPREADKVRLNKNWKRFVATSDVVHKTNFNAQLALSARTIARDGEVLHVWHDTPDPTRPLAMHVLEVDHLDTARTEARGDNVVIQGVEFDRDGQRVAYWLFDRHPGEPLLPVRTVSLVSKRVSAERVDHIFDILRPGQARGVPWLAPVALKMRDVGEYEEAELIRKKVEACFSAFVRRNDDALAGQVGTRSETEAATGRKVERLSPGMIHYLQVGEEISFGEPRQQIAVSDYLKLQWLSIAFGMGMPYSMATGDLSGANYSSQREGKLDFWMVLDHYQWNMLIPMAYEKAWRRVHESFGRLGQGPRGDDIPEPTAAVPKRAWVDPDKDGKALERDLRTGRMLWPQMIAETGEDPDEHLDTYNEWKPRVMAAGFDFGGTKPAASPAASADDDAGAGGAAGGDGDEMPDADDMDAADAPTGRPAVDADRAADRAAASAQLGEMVRILTRLGEVMATISDGFMVLASRETPPPAAPVVNVEPRIEIHQDGKRAAMRVVRDADNRVTGIETVE